MLRCPKCWNEVLTGYRFCPQCGVKLWLEGNVSATGNRAGNVPLNCEELAQQFSDWCFWQSSLDSHDHEKFTRMAADYFRQRGWHVIREYGVEKHPYFKVGTGERGERGGLVDVRGHLNDRKFVLEYDRCSHIRYKSVEKLFFSDADIAIGIVRGSQYKSYLRTENIQRVKQTASDLDIKGRAIYLIIVENKTADWILV